MRPIAFFCVALVAVAANSSLAADDLMAEARAFFKPIPYVAPATKGNAVTREKVALGKMLYFDPRLSVSGIISCNTCHNIGMGGDDNQETSLGHSWAKGPRNAPTVFNAVFNVAQFWDGRAEDLKTQTKAPIQSALEMNSSPALVVAVINSITDYQRHFAAAFPGVKDPVTYDNVANALEAFETTLITPVSRFDQYLEGNEKALDTREKRGLRAFMDTGCVNCHNGINVGGGGYYPFGVLENPAETNWLRGNKRRFAVTNTADDEYVFRAPSLRNVALTAPYFHSGQVWDLNEAVKIMGSIQIGKQLGDDHVDWIRAFLETLTGEQPQIEYPTLPPRMSNTPRPEPMSRNNPAKTSPY